MTTGVVVAGLLTALQVRVDHLQRGGGRLHVRVDLPHNHFDRLQRASEHIPFIIAGPRETET